MSYFFVLFENILPDGVIGNTTVFGTVIPGSSPGRVTNFICLAAYAFRINALVAQLDRALDF